MRQNENAGGGRIRMTIGLIKGTEKNIGGDRKEDSGMKGITEKKNEMIKIN